MKPAARFRTIVIVMLAATACSRYPRAQMPAPAPAGGQMLFGLASFYGSEFSGRRTASGEKYNPSDYTAAHRSLPFGVRVRVTNLVNNRSVVVTINDRGPLRGGRIIDLSFAAAKELDMIRAGVVKVSVQILQE